MSKSETIFIVDDDEAVRSLLRDMLAGSEYNIELFGDAQQFIEHYSYEQQGCVILDINMPGMSGLELQRELTSRGFQIPIIFVTGLGDVSKSVQAMKAGAEDFIEKPFRQQALLDSIARAITKSRQGWIENAELKSIRDRIALLTTRETDVFGLLVSSAGNLSNKEIARELGISHRTVDHHRARIMEKMSVDSVSELCLLAHKVGISISND